jgi:hypothetical protein
MGDLESISRNIFRSMSMENFSISISYRPIYRIRTPHSVEYKQILPSFQSFLK